MIGVGGEGPLGPDGRRLVPGGPAPDPGAGPAASATRAPGPEERAALAVLVSVDGLGPATLGRLLVAYGSARSVLAAAERGETAALMSASRHERWQASPGVIAALVERARQADAVAREIDRAAVELVALDDPDYPPRLRSIELPPHLLFVRGDRSALREARAVAVVGTRRPSESGRLIAARIAGALVRAGAAVVSGLAVGIDGAAHAAVLAEEGRTVGVLGGGHERLFPRSHRRLVESIVAAGGAVVSELPPDAAPTRGTFPRRNRIISGLSEATIVVEAGARSGALLTAQWALEQGRDCFVVPGPIDRPTSAGCLSLLREASGVARIVAGIPQLLEDLDLVDRQIGGGPPLATSAAASLVEMGDVPRRIAAEIVRGHTTTDELVAVTRYPIATVLTALTLLEARGLVVDAYGRYRPVGRLASRPAGRRGAAI